MAEIQVDYKRDMQSSYMVIGTEKPCRDTYQTLMLLNNRIEGLLPMELRSVDNRNEFYYVISSKQTYSRLYEKKKLGLRELRKIIRSIIEIVNRGKEYLLEEDNFLITPDYIYMTIPELTISLCYLPGYRTSMLKQLSSLFEVMLNQVDYKDEGAVLLIYGLYMASREDGCTFETLLGILRERQESIKLEERENIEKEEDWEQNKDEGIDDDIKAPELRKYNRINNEEKCEYRTTAGKMAGKEPEASTAGNGTNNPFLNMPKAEKRKRILISMGLFAAAAAVVCWGINGNILYRPYSTKPDLIRILMMAAVLSIAVGMAVWLLYPAMKKKRMVIRPVRIEQSANRGSCRMDSDMGMDAGTAYQCAEERDQKEADQNQSDVQAIERDRKDEWVEAEEKTVLLADFLKEEYCLVPAGAHTDERAVLEEFPYFIGKWKEHVNLAIEDSSVSRLHARITKEGQEYFITDLNSTNGTFLNSERLEPNETRKLDIGDEIAFAGRKYRFVVM